MKRNTSLTKCFAVAFCLLSVFFIAFSVFAHLPTANCQLSSYQTVESSLQAIAANPELNSTSVAVGCWLINTFGYEYTKGDFTADMYIYFFWTNPDVLTIDWHFGNGYPITPASITLVQSNTTGNLKYEVYRATAHLSSSPDASNFPFDKINLTISVEVLTHGKNLTLFWLNDQTGIDPQFSNPGWKTDSLELSTSTHNYPLGVQVPKADMIVTQERQRASTSVSPFIPPLIFSLVCAVSFLFGLKEPGSVALRIGLNTSMLVTTLLFSFAASSNIPPASSMVLFTMFILCVLIFMVSNLVVTIIGVVGWAKYKNEKRTKLANQLGFLISIIVPIIIFLILLIARA
jgi:hypothetical protein